MRKAVILLSLSTLLFAALSAYLAIELRSREPAPHAAMMASCPNQQAAAPLAVEAQPVSVSGTQPAPGLTCDAHRAAMDSAQQKSQAEFRAQLARDLADPVKRAAMVEQGKKAFRSQDPRLKEFMGMKEREFDEFLTLLAVQGVQYQEWFLNCEKTL